MSHFEQLLQEEIKSCRNQGRLMTNLDTLKNIVTKGFKEKLNEEEIMCILDVNITEYQELHQMLKKLLSDPEALKSFEERFSNVRSFDK